MTTTDRSRRPIATRAALGTVLTVAALTAGCAGKPPEAAPDAWTPIPAPPVGAASAAPLGPPAVVAPGRPGEPASLLPGGAGAGQAETVTPADVTFVSMMIPHHEQALVMSGLASTRAADPRVRSMADRIAGVQGAEIAMLRGWLNRHGGAAAGGGGMGGMGGMGAMRGMATPTQLDGLAASSGPAFDRAFLDLMIAHHEGALDMARTAQVDGRDVDALQIADDVVATQSADIARMRGMYPA